MARDNIAHLLAFLAVAKAGSFTRAAAVMGVSQSALSHTIRGLETDMGVRLLNRTTRSVAPTEAGERLLQTVAPRLEAIEMALAEAGESGDKTTGTVRISAIEYAANTVLAPRLARLLPNYPDLKVETTVSYGLTDIAAERFDIGIWWGDQVTKGLRAVRVAPDSRMVIAGSPAYLATRPAPGKPHDLLAHNCITLRAAEDGTPHAWGLKRGRRTVQVRVEGQAIFNGVYQCLNAALAGDGLAFLPEDLALPYITDGRLSFVLEGWFPTVTGLHMYYARRRPSRALSLVVDALRLPQ